MLPDVHKGVRGNYGTSVPLSFQPARHQLEPWDRLAEMQTIVADKKTEILAHILHPASQSCEFCPRPGIHLVNLTVHSEDHIPAIGESRRRVDLLSDVRGTGEVIGAVERQGWFTIPVGPVAGADDTHGPPAGEPAGQVRSIHHECRVVPLVEPIQRHTPMPWLAHTLPT